MTGNKFDFLTLNKIETLEPKLGFDFTLRELIKHYKSKYTLGKTIILYCCRVYNELDFRDNSAEDLVAREISTFNKFQSKEIEDEEYIYFQNGICNLCNDNKRHFCTEIFCDNYENNLFSNKCSECFIELNGSDLYECGLCKKKFCRHHKSKHTMEMLKNLEFMRKIITENKDELETKLNDLDISTMEFYFDNIKQTKIIKSTDRDKIRDLNTYDDFLKHLVLYNDDTTKELFRKYIYLKKNIIIQSIIKN